MLLLLEAWAYVIPATMGSNMKSQEVVGGCKDVSSLYNGTVVGYCCLSCRIQKFQQKSILLNTVHTMFRQTHCFPPLSLYAFF